LIVPLHTQAVELSQICGLSVNKPDQLMQSTFIQHPSGKIHCLQFGQGAELLIALHGFSDRARMFAVLEPALAQKYTVVAVDWPFHGQTEWAPKTFSKQDLLDIILKICAEHGKERFSMMGFSFGGRLAQAMLPELAGRLNKLYLLSPDGVKTKGMSTAAHTPMWVRRLLYRMLQNPNWFIAMVNVGKKLGVAPPLIHHFLTNNLNRPERFRRTFGCWMAMESFYLRRHTIQRILKESQLSTDVYIGLNDPMLRQNTLKKLYEGLPEVRVFWLDEGHRLIGEELGECLLKNG
jgi:pimeloyl-ACP methyl ester carboxylesterase